MVCLKITCLIFLYSEGIAELSSISVPQLNDLTQYAFRVLFISILFHVKMFGYYALPNPQLGYMQVSQSRQRPPCPSAAKSSAVIVSSAMILGSMRSNIVRLEYMTHPGNPKIGISPSAYASKNMAPGSTCAP